MSRELDGLLTKLAKINADVGGEDGKKKKKDASDRFNDLKNVVGERIHRLKFVRHISNHSCSLIFNFSV